MWTNSKTSPKDINRDDFVKVQARVELYRNRPQLAVQQVRLAKPEEIDLADYLPHTTADVEKMFAELRGYAESIANPWLKQLTLGMLGDPRSPAATSVRLPRKSCTTLTSVACWSTLSLSAAWRAASLRITPS